MLNTILPRMKAIAGGAACALYVLGLESFPYAMASASTLWKAAFGFVIGVAIVFIMPNWSVQDFEEMRKARIRRRRRRALERQVPRYLGTKPKKGK